MKHGGVAEEGAVPLLVVVLAGNPVTAAAVLACMNTADTHALRRLHPAVADGVAAVPWADTDTTVRDAVRWRAALPAAVGAQLPAYTGRWYRYTWGGAAIAALAGVTHLTIEGCSTFATLLPHLPPSLTSLVVQYIKKSPTLSFAHLHALTTLDCSQNDAVTGRVVRSLPPSLRELRIQFCNVAASADFRHLRALQRLFCAGTDVSPAVVASLPPSLELIDYGGSWANWPSGVSLAHLTCLHVIRAAGTGVTTAALVSLPVTLAELDLTESVLRGPFNHLQGLRTLTVTHTSGFTDALLASLQPSLVSLDASRCFDLTEEAVLPHLPALQTLIVSHTRIGDALLASAPPSLVTLHVEECSNVTHRVSMDHLCALRVLLSGGTDVPSGVLAACRARGGIAPVGCARSYAHNHTSRVNALVALADGRVVSGGDDATVQLWDLEAFDRGATVAVRTAGPVSALAVFPDGRRVAIGVTGTSGKNRGGVIVWDSGAATSCNRTTIYRGSVQSVAMLPNGALAVGRSDGAVHVLDADTGAVMATLAERHTSQNLWHGRALAVWPCSGWLAVGVQCGDARVWEVGARVAQVATLTTEWGETVQLADGRVASGDRHRVQIFDAATGTCIQVLGGLTASVIALAALPDGRLAGGSVHGTVWVWDTRLAGSHTPRVKLGCVHGGSNWASSQITALLPLPGGRLVSAAASGSVELWHVPSPSQALQLCDEAPEPEV